MSPARITARIDGWDKLKKLLNGSDPFYALPWIDALGEASELAQKAIEEYAPGSQQGKVKTAMQKRPVPLWARARVPNRIRGKARDGRPFRVLGALHGSKRVKYNFRSGPHSGELTFGWFDKARDAVMNKIWPLLTKAEREIEKRWNRG